MTRRLLAVALLGAAAVLISMQDASAFGGRKKSCDTPCASACEAPCTVTYVDQKVTAHKAEWKTKKVDIEVCENVWVDQKYKYTVCEPVTTKSKVKVCEIKQTMEPFKYMVNTWSRPRKRPRSAR